MAFDTKTYRATVGDHRVDFEFDKSGVVINRGRLFVDGRQVDQRAVHYGESTVSGELPDGRTFKVTFGSGFVGQLKHVELELGDDTIPLERVED
jgi:hypothetical protein